MSVLNCSLGLLFLLLTQSQARVLKVDRALLADQLEGKQSATSKLSGTTGGSTESIATLTITGRDTIATTGKASTRSNGTGAGLTEASSKTSGYVRRRNNTDDEDAPYVANSSVGITASRGGKMDTTTEAWGSSGQGPDGPSANAGHNVEADGDYTGSTGDQAVALLSEKP